MDVDGVQIDDGSVKVGKMLRVLGGDLLRQYRLVAVQQLHQPSSDAVRTINLPANPQTPDALASKTEAVREILRHLSWTDADIEQVESEMAQRLEGSGK